MPHLEWIGNNSNIFSDLLFGELLACVTLFRIHAVLFQGLVTSNSFCAPLFAELTTVQQAMSNVNHSYEDLGVLLNEKISELESMLSKMQNIQEESASMMHWLQKMDKTASDWEAAPTDSEAVKAQVEQHKVLCAFKEILFLVFIRQML